MKKRVFKGLLLVIIIGVMLFMIGGIINQTNNQKRCIESTNKADALKCFK